MFRWLKQRLHCHDWKAVKLWVSYSPDAKKSIVCIGYICPKCGAKKLCRKVEDVCEHPYSKEKIAQWMSDEPNQEVMTLNNRKIQHSFNP